jgi:hypothetical protein
MSDDELRAYIDEQTTALSAWSASELGRLSGCVLGCTGCYTAYTCVPRRALMHAVLVQLVRRVHGVTPEGMGLRWLM